MSDESLEIIETIRDRRDRAVYAHGRTAAAMDVMHLSPFEQAVYVDAALNIIDRLTAERDAARAELAKLRSVIWSAYADTHAYLYTANGTPEKVVAAYETLKAAYESIREALGIESEVDHE